MSAPNDDTFPFLMSALADVRTERYRQWAKFGDQSGLGRMLMLAVLMEEVGEVSEAILAIENEHKAFRGAYTPDIWDKWSPTIAHLENLRAELVQVAAVAVQMIEHIDTEVR